ncbi:hypothetical protein Tco_0550546 [Tanacetum coccineum]
MRLFCAWSFRMDRDTVTSEGRGWRVGAAGERLGGGRGCRHAPLDVRGDPAYATRNDAGAAGPAAGVCQGDSVYLPGAGWPSGSSPD